MDKAHPNLSADRPPSHTPGEMIKLIISSVGEVEEGQETNGKSSEKKRHAIRSRRSVSDEAPADTYHIEGHDDHEIDADASAGGGKLPVLLHKIPANGGKLLHRNETENHHGKHGGQDEGNLKREKMEGCDGGHLPIKTQIFQETSIILI